MPRLSRICRAWTVSIWLIALLRTGWTADLAQAGAGVVLELALQRQLDQPRRPPRLGGGALDAPAEALGGRPQGELGVDAELAGDVDRGEQDVADLVEAGLAVGAPARARSSSSRTAWAGRVDAREVEAGRARPAAGPCARTRGPGGSRAGRRRGASRPSCRALDLVPVAADLAGVRGLGVAEHVRVAADQLLGAVVGDRGQGSGAALLEQQGEEVDLEEDVAELVEQLRVVARVGRVGELVGLLDGVRDDRALVLLAVPRALAAQAPGQLVEAEQRRLCPPPPGSAMDLVSSC